MVRVVTICNQKGGVSKTATTVNLAIELSKLGKKVLVIDLDAQCNLSCFFNYKNEGETGAYNILYRKGRVEENIYRARDGIYVLPGCKNLSTLDLQLSEVGREYRLQEGLKSIREQFDYILIDTPPALGLLTINAIAASTDILIVTPLELFGLYGLKGMLETINAIKRYCNKDICINGILITRYIKRANLNKALEGVLEDISQNAGCKVYKTRVRESAAMKESITAKKGISEYDKESITNQDFQLFVKEFLNNE